MPNGDEELYADYRDLLFDLRNPRSPGEEFADQTDALQYLVLHADVDELVTSIRAEGWLDFEPLIVDRESKVVYEGNRRLAALLLISDAQARAAVGYGLKETEDPQNPPDSIRVKWVDGRGDARAFIGFKHINGPLKWDALAKAKFAAEWLDSPGAELSRVARSLGDAHSTVRRLVNGWRILQQAKLNGFDPSPEATGKTRFSFSHLYTALARPNVRHFLGLDPETELLPKNAVAKERVSELGQLMQWLFGQGSKPSVIGSQNPDLNRLVEVMGSERAMAMLSATNSLSQAFEIVEDKKQQFREALLRTVSAADDAMRLHPNYEGSADDLATANQLVKTSRVLRDSMQRIADGDGAADAD